MDCGISLKSYHEVCMMKNAKVAKLRVGFLLNSLIVNMSYYIHDVTPKVVAIAVRIVIAMWMIFFQISCLFIVVLVFVG